MIRYKNHILWPDKIEKRHFVRFFLGVVGVLFVVRLLFPSVVTRVARMLSGERSEVAVVDTIMEQARLTDSVLLAPLYLHRDLMAGANGQKHKIYSVSSYKDCFPDINPVQLATAQRLGMDVIENREAAEHSKDRLVYAGLNPYYNIKTLYSSIPYLVPRAQMLLERIARNFLDSQYVKHIPPSKLLVTSMTRTQEDVDKLRRHNRNASEQSCHCHGTTFDISYLHYVPVQDPDGPAVRPTRNDTLKYVLSEVLNDLRRQGTCYVKYEAKQSCFHITVR